MTLSNRKPLFLALALTLAAPLAFAQSTTPQSQEQQSQPTQTTTEATQSTTTQSQDPYAKPTSTQSTTESTTSTTAPTGTQADAMAETSGEPQKKNWSDLDVDKNGTLNAAEAASVQSLAKAFTEADANADGELTQDEYKAFLASSSGKATPRSGG